MLGGEQGHLVGDVRLVLLVVDHWLHGLLVIFTAIVTVVWVTLYIYNARTLAQLPSNLKPFLNLIFVKGGRAILGVHFRQATPFGSGFRDCSITVLILFVDEFDLGLEVFVGVGRHLRYFVYFWHI